MMQLQRKVKVEKFFGGVNHKEKKPIVVNGNDVDGSMLKKAAAALGLVNTASSSNI